MRKNKTVMVAAFISVSIALAANSQVNDTINGVVTDSLTASAVDSASVGSEGVSAVTRIDGSFTLILPSSTAVAAHPSNQTQGIIWDSAKNAFSWPARCGAATIRISDLAGKIVARFSSANGSIRPLFSIGSLQEGVYLASLTLMQHTQVVRITRTSQGSVGLVTTVASLDESESGALDKSAATTHSHTLAVSKSSYVSRSVTVGAGIAAAAPVPVKLFPSTFNAPWGWAGVVGTGQSLAVGEQGTPIKSTTQPYHNLKISTGTLAWPIDPTNAALAMVPLVEPIERLASNYPSSWPTNIAGETPHSAMGNQISALAMAATGQDYVSVQGEFGESGQCMTYLKKNATQSGVNGRAYQATTIETQAVTRLATAAGKTYGIGAIIITHGECDAWTSTYENDLHQLWSDYNTDLRAITGQTQNIQMFVSQQHSSGGDHAPSTLAQWKVGVDYPATIVCSGPKYQYPYASDHTHLLTDGYRQLGEKYGEIYFQRIVLGNKWQPLQPTTIQHNGAVVTVHYHVPVFPLVWETTFQAPHQDINEWKTAKGFEVTNSGGTKVTITSVAIAGDAVVITCASDPGANAKIGYAMITETAAMATPYAGTVHWGLLRDSDPIVGAVTKTAQPNYGVAFETTVP